MDGMTRNIDSTVDLKATTAEIEDVLRANPGRLLSDADGRVGLPGRTIRTCLVVRVVSGATVAHGVVVELGTQEGEMINCQFRCSGLRKDTNACSPRSTVR